MLCNAMLETHCDTTQVVFLLCGLSQLRRCSSGRVIIAHDNLQVLRKLT